MSTEIDKLAADFQEAVSANDLDAIDRFLGPNFEIWRNNSHSRLDRRRSIKQLSLLSNEHLDHTIVDVQRRCWSGGYVQQHTMLINLADTSVLPVPVCFVADVQDNVLTHMDVYVDEGLMAQAIAATSAQSN